MNDRLENSFRDSITKPARYLGGKVLICHGHRFQGRGWPDIFVTIPQWRGWLELKVKAPLEKHQSQMVRDLRQMRCPCYVLRHRPQTSCVLILDEEERELGVFENWSNEDGSHGGMGSLVRQVQELGSMLSDTDPWYYEGGVKKTREMGL